MTTPCNEAARLDASAEDLGRVAAGLDRETETFARKARSDPLDDPCS